MDLFIYFSKTATKMNSRNFNDNLLINPKLTLIIHDKLDTFASNFINPSTNGDKA